MGFIGGSIGYHVLRRISPGGTIGGCTGDAYRDQSKLETLFGPRIWERLVGKTVIDFGCGPGEDTVDICMHGAGHVIGVDIREDFLQQARQRADQANCSSTVRGFEINGRASRVLPSRNC